MIPSVLHRIPQTGAKRVRIQNVNSIHPPRKKKVESLKMIKTVAEYLYVNGIWKSEKHTLD
jgi:hypothetical protein